MSIYDLVIVVAPLAVVVTVEVTVAARNSAFGATYFSRTTAEKTWATDNATNSSINLNETVMAVP